MTEAATSGRPQGRIVVGIDGSEESLAALRWAADEARRRGCSLEVVTALHLSVVTTIPAFGIGAPVDDMAAQVRAGQVETIEDEGLTADGDPPVVATVEIGHPAHVLLEAAEGAQLTVVGSRGRGGIAGMLLGSTSSAVVAHSTTPVVVVPLPTSTD